MSRDVRFVRNWIQSFANRVAEHRETLTTLDRAIGDGDHGQNMHRGMQAATDGFDADDPNIQNLLRQTAMALISKTGGASGPLYGTFFMEAGKVAPEDEIGVSDWAAMMRAGLEGVQRRGKAETGEKTMVDALVPAIEALEDAAENGTGWADALKRAADAAQEGMEATTPLVATKGRASYLGERSAGHQDPGATSTFHLFAAATDAEDET